MNSLKLTKCGPNEANHWNDQSQEEEERILRSEQYNAADDQCKRNWKQTVSQHTHWLEKWSEKIYLLYICSIPIILYPGSYEVHNDLYTLQFY